MIRVRSYTGRLIRIPKLWYKQARKLEWRGLTEVKFNIQWMIASANIVLKVKSKGEKSTRIVHEKS